MIHISEILHVLYKSSAVAEMGDHARAKWAKKWGDDVTLSVGGGSWVPI